MNNLRWTPCLLAFSLFTLSATAETTWPGFRGSADPTVDLPETFGLELEWSRELGSGYSGIAIAGNRLVTAYTTGDNDVVGAFDRTTGETLWTATLAEKYAGHDGSDDGPLSTPTIVGDTVFVLGARGQLVALALDDGSERWKVQLDESNSTPPFYGYTASPFVTDDLVIISTGGDGRAITAYDRSSGEQRWARGDDTTTYQTPIRAELAGRSQLVAVTDQWALGLEPRTGAELWSFRHTEGETRNESAHPTFVGNDRVLVNLQNEALMLEVGENDGMLTAKEVWRSKVFANSLVLPVFHDGHLYGFTGNILTSANADSGEINWRTRNTSAFNLTLVDGHLIIFDRSGELVVVAANPQEYAEIARLPALDRGDYANPAYADGRFYIRNLSHLASVELGAATMAKVEKEAEVDELIHRGAVGELAARLEKLDEGARQAEVEAFFEKTDSLPIVDGALVTFVHRGAKEDVAVTGDIFGWTGETEVLHHVEGTDLFYRSFELDPRANYSYTLAVDYEQPAPDPANPLTIGVGFVQSELRMPEFRANPALFDPAEDAAKGRTDTFQFTSKALDNTREIQVWLPPGYDNTAESSYPMLVVHHGDQAVTFGNFINVLDNLVGSSVEPLVVVLVPRRSGAEFNGPQAGDYLRFLTEELIPHVERHYRVSTEAARRAVTGVGSAGVISLHAALAHPGLFGKVATQSFYLGDPNREAFWELVASSEAMLETVWIESGPNDYDIPNADIDAETSSKDLIERLRARDVDVHHSVAYGTAGWAGWRAQSDLILEALFPAESNQD